MTKLSISVLLLCASLSAQNQLSSPVLQWNRILLAIVRTPGAQPATIHTTRSFAIMHTAMYEAINTIDDTQKPHLVHFSGFRRTGSEEAAAAAAAHEVLVNLYPNFQAMLDAQLQQSLVQISDGSDKAAGVSIGQDVADRLLAQRSNDGSNAQPPLFVFENGPGSYQSTPPNFPQQPQFTHWSHVTPFALERADQFRPAPPPALTSDAYSDVLNEVKAFGMVNSTAASADQALVGRFWNGAIQNYWNEIAQTAALKHRLTIAQSAHLFALLNVALADSVIAFYDAKYAYNLWRPVTAVRSADTDENPETLVDLNWLPEVGNTPPDPSYPGAHAVISTAAATVLNSLFPRDRFEFAVTSEVLPGVERSFENFSAAAEEAAVSRIFAGVHFRSDLSAGQQLGRQVAHSVLEKFLTQLDRESGSGSN
jgi:membrane-associated phospholipid phosphatase